MVLREMSMVYAKPPRNNCSLAGSSAASTHYSRPTSPELPFPRAPVYGTALAIVAIYVETNIPPISPQPHRIAFERVSSQLFTFDMRAIVLTGVIMPAYVLAYAVEHITTMPPVPRQLPAGLSSARAYLSSCGYSCTDVIQSEYQSARLRVNPDDKYCNNYGNTPGQGGCYCGNYQNDGHAVSLLSSCIVNTCTKASQEVLNFIDVTGDINALAFTGDVQPLSPITVTITSSSTKPTLSSGSGSSSATPSTSHSSTASSTSTSTSTSTSSTLTGSPTSSSDSAPQKLVIMDSVYLATTLCGVFMAVTAYML
ncbi:hypothetical protein EDD18DRAFT_1464516 [Armillaria luteobubalina]|uniref:Uncharacterized protein n=1 Tax=Armillaria luteobubalina TaxID=153913 RepID=A0AA39Q0L8_9AGAR|nr:hypothetical protein EDD18DRAFT_1464516 [Armillaria luteobubalina]